MVLCGIRADTRDESLRVRRIDIVDGVHLVRGVRTGFQHLVVDTGGARAFAATGALIYAPAAYAEFLESALNDPAMPPDTVVLNSHSAPQTPVSRLSKYLENERCQAPGG